MKTRPPPQTPKYLPPEFPLLRRFRAREKDQLHVPSRGAELSAKCAHLQQAQKTQKTPVRTPVLVEQVRPRSACPCDVPKQTQLRPEFLRQDSESRQSSAPQE